MQITEHVMFSKVLMDEAALFNEDNFHIIYMYVLQFFKPIFISFTGVCVSKLNHD